jgi:hypothetical protein
MPRKNFSLLHVCMGFELLGVNPVNKIFLFCMCVRDSNPLVCMLIFVNCLLGV